MKGGALIAVFLLSQSAGANGTSFLPESHHRDYGTYGLFIDDQTSILYRDGGRAWGSIAAAFALLGSEFETRPSQLAIGASINTSFRLEGGLAPETADARFTVAWETRLTREWRLSAGYRHVSGHINDCVLAEDRDLIPVDQSLDSVFARFIRDVGGILRPGFTIDLLVDEADPRSKLLRGNAFTEFYPWGRAKAERAATPYLAAGVEGYGHDKIEASFHAQIGAAFGDHGDSGASAHLRTVLGFYTGQDPRLKSYYYKNRRVSFAYTGLELEL